jgi:hypothetical protein
MILPTMNPEELVSEIMRDYPQVNRKASMSGKYVSTNQKIRTIG